MADVVEMIRNNPVRVRAALVSVLTVVGMVVPSLAGIESNEALVGAVMAVLALVFGWDASTRVVLPPDEDEDAEDEADVFLRELSEDGPDGK